jgi:hypothetical protein
MNGSMGRPNGSPKASRLLRLEGSGRLLVATDLQGNLRDLHKLILHWRELVQREPDSHLIVTGDLVHGPEEEPSDWPDYLGTYYFDDSPGVLRTFAELQAEFPGRVHALLGNHEHAHIGGPIVSKFFPDEAAHLESKLPAGGAAALRAWLRTWPIVAVASNGAVLTHGAPAATVRGPEDFAVAPQQSAVGTLSGYEDVPLHMMSQTGLLGALLWARHAEPEQARNFAGALGGTFCIYGHDIVREGYELCGREQICVSTSFGLYDEDKHYLELCLDRRYESAEALRPGEELKRLYPEL